MSRLKYIRAQDKVINAAVNRFSPVILKALNKQISSFITALRENPNDSAKALDAVLFNPDIADTLLKVYKLSIPMANFVYESLSKRIKAAESKGFGYNEKWTQEVIDYFTKYLLTKSVLPITETTKEQIRAILKQAAEQGWGVDKIISELRNSPLTRYRAMMIVRTEVHNATGFASMLAANEFGYEMDKTWIEVKDNRTRRTHRHGTGVGGEKIGLDEVFSNGLKFPGDPDGPAKEVINCRCVLAFEPKRDENGRLIRKPTVIPMGVRLGFAI